MKKINLIAILIIAMFTSYSCSKDDVEKIEKKSTLENTIWVGDASIANTTYTISFYKDECTTVMSHKTMDASSSYVYTYTYSHPIVTFTPKDTGNAVLKGVINENKMTVTNTSKEVLMGVVEKQ